MRNGFTLIELLVVITIASILMMIAMPNFKKLKDVYIVKGEIQRFVAFLNVGKSAALRNNEETVIVIPKGRGVMITTYLDKNHDGIKNMNENLDEKNKPMPNLEVMEEMDVFFPDASWTKDEIKIKPSGILDKAHTVILKYGPDQYRKIDISVPGRITILRSYDGVTWRK